MNYEVPVRYHHRHVQWAIGQIMSLELNEEVSARDKNLGITCICMIFEAMKFIYIKVKQPDQ